MRTTAFNERFDQYGSRTTTPVTRCPGSSATDSTTAHGSRSPRIARMPPAIRCSTTRSRRTAAASFRMCPRRRRADASDWRQIRPRSAGRRRAVFGANSGAIDHTIQDQVKLRGGYALNDWFEAEGFVAVWRNDTDNENRTFDARSGRQASVVGRRALSTASRSMFRELRSRRARARNSTCSGARRCARRAPRLERIGGLFRVRHSRGFDAASEHSRSSRGRRRSWHEHRARWHGLANVRGARRVHACARRLDRRQAHARGRLSRNEYQLANPVYNTADWRQRAGVLQDVFGETRLKRCTYKTNGRDGLVLTLGVRYEDWSAFAVDSAPGSRAAAYPERTDSALSPKATLAYVPEEAWHCG